MTKIILLCAFATLCGCTNMNIKMQKILSATDCIESYLRFYATCRDSIYSVLSVIGI